uniref:Uncharacterized protein n=1 Tax=Micrurus surinamensis TaxID=129470 RepID=A0A2D4NTD6_MICSU
MAFQQNLVENLYYFCSRFWGISSTASKGSSLSQSSKFETPNVGRQDEISCMLATASITRTHLRLHIFFHLLASIYFGFFLSSVSEPGIALNRTLKKTTFLLCVQA